jgi:hypothetical protein
MAEPLLNQNAIILMLEKIRDDSAFLMTAIDNVSATLRPSYRDRPITRTWTPYNIGQPLTERAYTSLRDLAAQTVGTHAGFVDYYITAINEGRTEDALKFIASVIKTHEAQIDKAQVPGQLLKERMEELIPEIRQEVENSGAGEAERTQCLETLDTVLPKLNELQTHVGRLKRLYENQPGVGRQRGE